MRIAVTLLLGVLAAFAPGRARAEPCPTGVVGADSVATVDGVARFRFIQRTLDRESRHARYWNHGWGWGLLGAAGAQAGAAQFFDDKADQAGMYVGAIKAAAGSFSTFVMMPVKANAIIASGPTPTCEDLARAERALVFAAKSERVGWFKHVEGIALNAAGVLYLGIEHDAWGKALAGALLGIGVGELRLWSRPVGAIHAMRRYRAGDIGGAGNIRDGGIAWRVAPLVGPRVHGLALHVQF